MKLTAFAAFFWLFAFSLAAPADNRAQAGAKEEEYGAKSALTISVRISGGGVRKPGLYHMSAAATLHNLLDQAIWLRSASGRFQVSRYVDGKKMTIDTDLDHWEFALIDGDEVYAGTMRKEDPPNQRPEGSPGKSSRSNPSQASGAPHP